MDSKKNDTVLKQWAYELREELKLIQSREINEEARSNMMSYSIPKEEVEQYGNIALSKFIASCKDIYQSKANNAHMVFYAWFDEQADQLRMSAVSQIHNKFPFECKYEICSIKTLSESVISQNSGLFTENKTLKIWQIEI